NRDLWPSARQGHSCYELSSREKPPLKHSQTHWEPQLLLHSQGPINTKGQRTDRKGALNMKHWVLRRPFKQFLLTAKVVNSQQSKKGITHPLRLTRSDGTVTPAAAFQPV